MKEATDIVASIQLPCVVSDANVIGEGKADINGQMLDTKNVEIACGNGMGYLLTSTARRKGIGLFLCCGGPRARQGPGGCRLYTSRQRGREELAGDVLTRLGRACQVPE